MATLVLRPVHTNVPVEESSYKGSPVGPRGPSSLKMVFALLTEVIAVHMRLIIIYLRYLSLERSLTLCWKLSRPLVQLQVGLYEFFEQFIGRGRSRSQSGNQSGNLDGVRGRVARRSGGGTPLMRTSIWTRVPDKLIFYRISRRGVPTRGTTRGTTRAGASRSHLENWLDWIG